MIFFFKIVNSFIFHGQNRALRLVIIKAIQYKENEFLIPIYIYTQPGVGDLLYFKLLIFLHK